MWKVGNWRKKFVFSIILFLPLIGIASASPGYDFSIEFFDVQRTDTRTYNTGEMVEVFATVKNTGDKTIEAYRLEGTLTITSPSGNVVHTAKGWNSWGTFSPGSITSLFKSSDQWWNVPSNAQSGWYSIKLVVVLKDTDQTKNAEKSSAFQIVGQPSASIQLRSKSVDGAWQNKGALFIEGKGSYNYGTDISLEKGTYNIIAGGPGIQGGAKYSFDHFEYSGGIALGNPNSQSTSMTVSGGGTLTEVDFKWDFNIEVSPASQTVTAGDAAVFNVKVSAIQSWTTNNNEQTTVDVDVLDIPATVTRSLSGPFYIKQSQPTDTRTLTLYTKPETPPGTYTITLKGTITSTSTIHSTTISLTIKPKDQPPPDLIIQDFYWTPSNPNPGDQVTFTYTEKNQGSGDATGHRVTLYVDNQVVSHEDISETLTAGSPRTRTFPHKWTATSGAHDVFVKADSSSAITESNEENNGFLKTMGTKETVPTTLTINLNPPSSSMNTKTYVTISGRLTRADTGAGVPDRPIKLEWTGGMTSVTTNSDGYYSYTTDVTYGKGGYPFTAKFYGYETSSTVYEQSSTSSSFSVGEAANQPPTAYIDSISPNPATQGQTVYFSGYGSDPDSPVVAYSWRSSLDGFLSSSKSFSIATLSQGTHTIYFKVQDEGAWSNEVSTAVVIEPKKTEVIKPASFNIELPTGKIYSFDGWIYYNNEPYLILEIQKWATPTTGKMYYFVVNKNGEVIRDKDIYRKVLRAYWTLPLLRPSVIEDTKSLSKDLTQYVEWVSLARGGVDVANAVRDGGARLLGSITATVAMGGASTGVVVTQVAKEVAQEAASSFISGPKTWKERILFTAGHIYLSDASRRFELNANSREKYINALVNGAYPDANSLELIYSEFKGTGIEMKIGFDFMKKAFPEADLFSQLSSISTNFAQGALFYTLPTRAELIISPMILGVEYMGEIIDLSNKWNDVYLGTRNAALKEFYSEPYFQENLNYMVNYPKRNFDINTLKVSPPPTTSPYVLTSINYPNNPNSVVLKEDNFGFNYYRQTYDKIQKTVKITQNFHITYNENSPDKEAASKIAKAEKAPAEAKQIKITVLVGGPLANAETAKYQDYFSVKVTNLYPGKNKGVIEVINNPDGEGKIVLLAGSDRNGTKAAVEIYSQLDKLPDKPVIVEWKDGNPQVVG